MTAFRLAVGDVMDGLAHYQRHADTTGERPDLIFTSPPFLALLMAAPLIVPVLPGVLGAGEQRQVLEPIVERDRPAGERTTNYPPEDAA